MWDFDDVVLWIVFFKVFGNFILMCFIFFLNVMSNKDNGDSG